MEHEIKIYYLKHSKYIVKAENYKGNIIKHEFSLKAFLTYLSVYALIMTIIILMYTKRFKGAEENERRKITRSFASFNVISIVIMILAGYTRQLTPLFIVMLVNSLLHFIFGVVSLKKYML